MKEDIKIFDALAKELCKRVGAPYPSPLPIMPTEYTWTQEQEDDYRKWATKYLMKQCRFKTLGKKYVDYALDWFLLDYGWMIAPIMGANEPKGGAVNGN